MRKIPENFEKITTLQELNDYLDKNTFKIKISFLGGRKFEHKGSKGDLTLNDIVRMFGNKVYDFRYGSKLLEKKDLVNKITKRIRELDEEGNQKLAKRGWFTRLMHFIQKSNVVIKEKSTTREDVLDEISSSVSSLEDKYNLKLTEVNYALDVFNMRSYSNDRNPFPDLTQEIKSTKSALTEFVKVNSQKNAEELMNSVEKLINKAEGLTNEPDQYKLFNERLEELILKLLDIDYYLSAFMFAAVSNARGEEDIEKIVISNAKLKNHRKFDPMEFYAGRYYKDYKDSKDSKCWWPEIKVNIKMPKVLESCSDSFK